MLAEVPRFHRAARRLLYQVEADGTLTLTLGRFLDGAAFSPYFRAHFMTPVVSAVWSCDAETALRYPAVHLFRFLAHHGMLSVSGAPVWRTVTGGSCSYVDRIAVGLHQIHTGTPVRTVLRHADGVDEPTDDGTMASYDHVVVARHADQALRLLEDAAPDEKEVIGMFRYSRNTTLLHTDTACSRA